MTLDTCLEAVQSYHLCTYPVKDGIHYTYHFKAYTLVLSPLVEGILLPSSWAIGVSGKQPTRKRESLQSQHLLKVPQLEREQGDCSPFLLKMRIQECWEEEKSCPRKGWVCGRKGGRKVKARREDEKEGGKKRQGRKTSALPRNQHL